MKNNIDKLVNDNISLIKKGYEKYKYIVLNHHHDELNSMANYALFKTASSYDETKGVKFSTLFYTILKNEIRKFYRDRNSSTRISIYGEDISLSAKIYDNDEIDIESCAYNENKSIDSRLLLNETFNEFLLNLGDRELSVLKVRYHNPKFTYSEIGDRLGLERWTVTRIMKSLRTKYILISKGVIFKPCPDKLIFTDCDKIIKNYDFKNNKMIYI